MLLNQRYEITLTLAEGSDSIVYKAQDHLKNKPVLLKAFFSNALQDWKRFQLIEREAKTLAQINHIQIPDFIDFFVMGAETEQTIYLVTEFIKGQTLSEKVEQNWKPDFEIWLSIADQILQTLHYIHAFEPPIVHRDIKPSNLMINEFNRVFLVDFGGVQEQLQSQGAGGSTMVGTVGYMAPEQLAGRAVPATDLFSLGITLLELLTGEPAEQLNPQNESLDLASMVSDLPKAWKTWLMTLVSHSLETRFPSAQEALRYIDLLQDKDFSTRTLFTPQAHKARLPEILQSLTLIERSEEDKSLVQGSILDGRFETLSLLGSGTHSRVYKGLDRKKNKPVVIKELCLENIENWKNLELFEREIDIMQQLNHPQIPQFISSFQVKEGKALNWYLVTEAVNGVTLDDKLNQGWRPTSEQVWQLAQNILEILKYLHSLKPVLVHRDIKPSNIIVTEEQNIYLIDFGAVQNRFWSEGGGGSTIIGTFGYMAPEQFGGTSCPESDLYALAATLVRLLSLKHPIEIPFASHGLEFDSFVELEAFETAWLRACLQPQIALRLNPTKALLLLKDHALKGELSQEWLSQQRSEKIEVSLEKKNQVLIVPENITPERLADFIADKSNQVKVSETGVSVILKGDPILDKNLEIYTLKKNRDILKAILIGGGFLASIFISSQWGLGVFFVLALIAFAFHFKSKKDMPIALVRFMKAFRFTSIVQREEYFSFRSNKAHETPPGFEVSGLSHTTKNLLHTGTLNITSEGIYDHQENFNFYFPRSGLTRTPYIPLTDVHSWSFEKCTSNEWEGLSEAPINNLVLNLDTPFNITIGSGDSSKTLWIYQRQLFMPMNDWDAQVLKAALSAYIKNRVD